MKTSQSSALYGWRITFYISKWNSFLLILNTQEQLHIVCDCHKSIYLFYNKKLWLTCTITSIYKSTLSTSGIITDIVMVKTDILQSF